MYLEGTYTESNQQFNKVHWGPTTAHYVTHAKEITDRRWAEVFRCLNSVLMKKRQAEYASHSGPPLPDTHLPIPNSNSNGNFPEPENEADSNEGITFSWHATLLADPSSRMTMSLCLLDHVC